MDRLKRIILISTIILLLISLSLFSCVFCIYFVSYGFGILRFGIWGNSYFFNLNIFHMILVLIIQNKFRELFKTRINLWNKFITYETRLFTICYEKFIGYLNNLLIIVVLFTLRIWTRNKWFLIVRWINFVINVFWNARIYIFFYI